MDDPSNAAARDGLKNALMKGSVSDILHDFGKIVSKTDLNKSVNFKTEILDGLPASGQDLITGSLTEEAFVNSIIDSINDKKPNPGYNFDFVPNTEFYSTIAGTDPFPPDFTFAKKKYTEHYQIIQKVIDAKFAQINEEYPPPPSDKDPLKTFNIKTITGFDYTVTQSVIKKEKTLSKNSKNETYIYNEPLPILKKLGIETNSAFVVDFAAVSLPDFLTQSDTNQPANEIKLYFISNPETENDPAGKTGVTTPAYKNISNKDFKNGVEIFSLQQTSTPSQVTNYTWTDSNNLSHNRFFTKYNFALSDLKEIKDKKLIKFQTDLTISYTDPISNKLYKEVIINSGNHGDITNVISSIISKIKDLFAPKRKTDNEVFYMNSKFQHKRSGDWLQVLSCLNLKENNFKSPNFKYPISPNNTTYNNQPFPLEEEPIISDVYFVTHDRIPFAVALLLGVNVVYTHNATGAYYVFKSTPAPSLEDKLAKYKQEVNKIIKSELYQLLKENAKSNDVLIDNVKEYNSIIKQKTDEFNLNIDTLLEKIASIKKIDLPLRDSNINDNIKKLFEELYRYSKFLAENKSIVIAIIKDSYEVITKYDDQYLDNDITTIENFVTKYKQYVNIYNIHKQPFTDTITVISPEYQKIINKWTMDVSIKLSRKIMAEPEINESLQNVASLIIWDNIFNQLPLGIKENIISTFKSKFIVPYEKDIMNIPDIINFIPGRLTDDTKKINEYNKFGAIIKKFLDDLKIKFKINIISEPSASIEPLAIEPFAEPEPESKQISVLPLEQAPEPNAEPSQMIVSEVMPIVNSETIPRDDKVILEYVTIKSLNIMSTFVGGRSTITKPKNAKTSVPINPPRSMKRTKRPKPLQSKLVAQYTTPSYARPSFARPLYTRPSYAINKTRKRSGDSFNILPPKYIKTEPELYQQYNRPKRPLSEDYLEISPPSELYKRIRTQAIPPVESEKPIPPHLIEEDDIMKYQELSVNRTYSLLNHILTTDYSPDPSIMPTLQDHSYCFHPLLPVFMLTEALCAKYNEFFEEYENEIANIDDRSSYDINADLFEDYEYYYHFFNALYSNIANKINPIDVDVDVDVVLGVAELYNIGLGLRSFFFTNSHNNIDDTNVSFSTFTSNLRNYISGYIELNKEEKDKDILFYEIGKLTINEIFDDKQFNEKINEINEINKINEINEINEIKTIVTDDSLKNKLLEDLYELRMIIATQIINDRMPLSTPMSTSASSGGKKNKFTKKINKIKYKKFTKHAHKKSKKHRTRKRSIQKHRIQKHSIQKHRIYKKASRVSTSHTKK